MEQIESNLEGAEIIFIGKQKEIDQEVLLEYYDLAVSDLNRVFEMSLDEQYELEIKRKYTRDRSYLNFLFEGEDKIYNAIFQRNGSGDFMNITEYMIEAVGKKGMITKICQRNGVEPIFDIPGVKENSKIRDKVIGILEELNTTEQLKD